MPVERRSSMAFRQGIPDTIARQLEKSGMTVEGQQEQDGGAVVYEVKNAQMPGRQVTNDVVGALVQEACQSTRGVIKRPEGDIVLDTREGMKPLSFAVVTKSVDIPFDDLPDDAGVAAIAEMTYARCLRRDHPNELLLVDRFPSCLARTEARTDYVIAGYIVVSFKTDPTTGAGSVKTDVHAIETLMERMCSQEFVDSVMPPKWKELAELDLELISDVLEEVQQNISDYWNDSAMDQRARAYATFLMNAVGSDLRAVCRAACDKAGGVFHCPKKTVELTTNLLMEWITICEKLTTIDWGADWRQGAFVDPTLNRVRRRMETATRMRVLYEEITELLEAQDFRAMRGDQLFDVLDSVDIFEPSQAVEEKWEIAQSALYRRLEPVEHRCATNLRDFFSQRINLSPQAILSEFMQFKELVKRPIIAKELCSERDTLLAKLSERTQSTRIEYERRAHSMESQHQLDEDRRCQAGRFMPGVVNKIVWVRQLRGRVQQMIDMSNMMLSDLARHKDFVDAAATLLSELEDYEQESFKNWTFDIEDLHLNLDDTEPCLRIEEGKIQVNYPERLVELLREVRLFTAMGFHVPKEIVQTATSASRFYQKGVALKQVANAYNTMNTDIIRSTKAMLLDSALNFEKVIGGNNSNITWSNELDAERFIAKLRKAATVLTDDNRLLHRLHSDITVIVSDLFKIDLLRSRDRWMNKVRQVREKIIRSNFSHTEAWTRHWDMQIYKALEHQYQMGLESLHQVLPEIRADVVFDAASGRAILRPSIEVLRDQYYSQLRDFLTFPVRFQGIGRNDFFRKMTSRNERAIMSVMTHSAQLFKKVEKELKRFQPMLVIGQCGVRGAPTLEAIVAAALTEVQHWEANIRLLKQKGKEIGNVDMILKIDCIKLSTAGIKSAVEEQLAKLADVLNSTLRKSAETHLKNIEEFLTGALEKLNVQYTKLEDLTKGNVNHAQLHEQRPLYEVEFHHFMSKNGLLQSMTNSQGIPYRDLKEKWEGFINRLESYEREVETQLEGMKSSVQSTVKAFFDSLEKFEAQWMELKPKDPKTQGATKIITEKKEHFEKIKEQGNDIKAQCAYFSLDEPDLDRLDDIEDEIKMYEENWATMDEFNSELDGLRNENWITFRTKSFRFEDFCHAWEEKLKGGSNPIAIHMRSSIDVWSRMQPVLKFVRGDGMTPTHWAEMFRLLGIDRSTTLDTLLFGHIIDVSDMIVAKEKELKHLHSKAQGEAEIRNALDDVRAWSNSAEFRLVPHQDRKGVMLITDWKDAMAAVSDNQALLMSLKDSPFFRPFAEDAQQWERRLALIDEYLHHMNQIQRKWVYLEPIFARGALPEEQPRFRRTDTEYLGVMEVVRKAPKVVNLSNHPEWKDRLKTILEQLERCQRALNDFLEEKREKFPRFYFISDDDLLEVLGQSRNVNVIQSHLKKLFMGINSVRFDKNQAHIVEICSLEGETVPLLTPVEIKVEVEDWLADLDVEMKRTLQQHLRQCVDKLDVAAYASQILCTCEQIHFTKKTEDAFRDKSGDAMRQHRASLKKQLADLTAFSAGNTDDVLGLKLRALIMDLIHNIEVVDMLLAKNVTTETDWKWRKQLRFYMDREGLCFMRMVDAPFRYSYEYQGNAPKLVHTPLTDKCYLTLTQGMHLGYGGNPYGPAGTGKTESVKALGNAMGRQVLVFNCDEGIDFKSMGRIFTGLVKCGAWGCFDEFNRLKVDQLSAVSQMIQVIQEALKNGEDHCLLLGHNTDVDANAGIFVTLNPAGKGYGGRSKLPDNLKQLFRSVAMSVPDNQLITETILFSEGFENATELAKKTVEMFRLSKQLLSAQQHYDWGLRALKAVLRLGGVLVHHYLKDKLTTGATPTADEIMQTESEILIKSLRVNTLSKLTFDDVKLFNGLINDIFPGVPIREIQYDELRPAIEASIKELKLQVVEGQIHKILQLYEALNQRMGVVLVGPSGSGKTTLLRILRKALQHLGTNLPMHVMNPKAIHRDMLLGHMDLDTREWFDGVLTEAAKRVVREEVTTKSWILCDGDIDPEWVESLNSVLDDNKLLTLPNGVRIQFGSNVNFVFETHSLEFASPATVSRMGMIFLSEEDVDPKVVVQSWLAEQPQEEQERLTPWMDDYFYKAIDTLIETKALAIETTKMGLVNSGLSQLHGCSSKAQFAMAMIRGLGSYLPEGPRVEYSKDVFHLLGVRPPDPKNPLDCFFDPSRAGLAPYQYEATMDLSVDDLKHYPMIKTVEVQRNLGTLEAWTRTGSYRPFILVGPEGCGKTMLLRNCFANLPNVRVATVNCSAQTVAAHVIQKLQQTCQVFNSNQGRVLRPKDADRLILVLKDLNLPKPDKYKTVQLHSFLQQLILYTGFYDKDLEWVTIEGVQIVASMNPPGSMGRFPVASRFVAIVSVLSLSYPTKSALETVYSDFFGALLQSQQLQQLPLGVSAKSSADFARSIVNVYEGVMKRFTVDDASHYIFNPRDLTRWILAVLSYVPENTDLLEILFHEGMRIFADRLINKDHRGKFEKLLLDSLAMLGWQRRDTNEKDVKYYVSFLDTTKQRALSVTKLDDLKKAADASRISYARENIDLELHLIPEVLGWLARIDRVLAQDGGSALLVGRTGTSAPELVRLAAHNLRMNVHMLTVTRDYTVKAFHVDVKVAVQEAGVEGQHCVLFIEEYNLVNPNFLERINSLLSSGEIPGLFTTEELDAQLGALKEEALSEGFTEGVYSYFVHRVMKYLHVMVVMDPANTDYEQRCRSNPALFTRCNVAWIGSWSTEGMKLVPKMSMRSVFKALEEREGKVGEFHLHRELVRLHQHAGPHFSPQHFKTLIATYRTIFDSKSSAAGESLMKLQSGLDKLAEAEVSVAKIQKEVAKQKKEMVKKQKEADEALVEIEAKMSEAGSQKKRVTEIQKDIDKEQGIINEKKTVIVGQLTGVQPVLDAAKQAVGQIKNEHLSELKALKTPPAAVQDVLEGVFTLLGKTDTSWATVRKSLAGDGVKQLILNFDSDTIDPKARAATEKLLKTKGNSFKPEVISRASKAAEPMAAWLKANIEYSTVAERVQPMRDELAAYQSNLDKFDEKLKKYEEKLKKIDGKIADLKKNFAAKTTEAERLKYKLEEAESTLESAQDLLSKLVGEKTRWSGQVAAINKDEAFMPKRALLAAGFITYLGREAEDGRHVALKEWMETLKVDTFDFFTFLRTESTSLLYKSQGLPGDSLSMENAVTILDCVRVPLIVDPANQALEWLKASMKAKEVPVEVCTPADERFGTTLELAVRFGKTLLISEVDKIEAVLYPLIRKELRAEGPKKVVRIGDKIVDYHENFKLYLLTRATDMKLPPDVSSFLSEVSFTVTRGGLEGQLLGLTIQKEQPELEQQKVELLKKEESLKLQLSGLEDTLLAELAASTGSLLENTTLIESLNQIKTQAQSIEESLAKSKELTVELDEKRNVYRPLAAKGSRIFFLMRDLSSLQHMYRFSLAMFLDIFDRVFDEFRGREMHIEDKIYRLGDALVGLVVTAVSRALFKDDRVTFGVHLARNLDSECCSPAEWDYFVDKSLASDTSSEPTPSWVLEEAVPAFKLLRASCGPMMGQLQLNETDEWYQWMRGATPEVDMPDFLKKVKPFQKLLIVKALRPDRLIAAMNSWACKALNVPSLSDATTLAGLLPITKCDEPIILITTPGADPSMELQQLAHEKIGRARFHQVAMGGGQAEEAMSRLKSCSENGEWLCLKNLHLVIPWVSVLEAELNLLKPHRDFRLWLTSEPHDLFPSILLSTSLKVTFEAPPGIKQNMLRTYGFWTDEYLSTKSKTQAQLLFALAFLHALMQERRSYIPQGWAKFYEFSQADIKSAADVIVAQSQNNTVDWDTIYGVFENAIYGGRMENDYDVRILRTYLEQLLNEDVLATAPKRQAELTANILLPASNAKPDFTALLKKLAESDIPAVFQLPPNSDRTVQRTRVAALTTDLVKLYERRETASMTREEWANSLQPLLTLWNTLCQPHADLLTTHISGKRDPRPVEGFIGAELDNAVGLVATVDEAMSDLRKCIEGTMLLTDRLKNESNAMLTGEVPLHWEGHFSGPEQIIPWLKALVRKAVAIRKWSQTAQHEGDLLRSNLDLSELFRPQTFLNALRQETARQSGKPLVSLRLVSRVGHAPEGCAIPIRCVGMQLQGAVLDREHLGEVMSSDAPMVTAMPELFLGWVHTHERSETCVGLPVYTNLNKDTFLMELDFECGGSVGAQKFILSGTAVTLEQ